MDRFILIASYLLLVLAGLYLILTINLDFTYGYDSHDGCQESAWSVVVRTEYAVLVMIFSGSVLFFKRMFQQKKHD